jgi:hypothetical protein
MLSNSIAEIINATAGRFNRNPQTGVAVAASYLESSFALRVGSIRVG